MMTLIYIFEMILYSLWNSLIHSMMNKMKVSPSNFMYQLIFEKQVQGSFPNVEMVHCMYLVLMVSNCCAECLFSKLILIKNRYTHLCAMIGSQLALMSIEADTLHEINFEDVVTNFAKKKARKVLLLKKLQITSCIYFNHVVNMKNNSKFFFLVGGDSCDMVHLAHT